jgi:hypothetical protein
LRAASDVDPGHSQLSEHRATFAAEAQVDSVEGARMSGEREQAIRQRAYEIWEQEGRPDGRDHAHWTQAEAEIEGEPVDGVTDKGKVLRSYEVDPAVPGRRRKLARRKKPKTGAG